MYDKHNESLERFKALFNNCNLNDEIKMKVYKKETYESDGEIIDNKTQKSIHFDWEYREKYFKNCKFAFNTLGQYERKLIKPVIDISIQCDSTETGVVVGWHEDWLKENKTNLNLSTDSSDQYGTVRYTSNFKVYSYKNISDLKAMLRRAFDKNTFNHEVF